MPQIEWDSHGQRQFETGVSRGVLYLRSDNWLGVPWNGLTKVDVNSGGLEKRPYHIDGVKFRFDTIGSDFEGSMSAYTYPIEMDTYQLNGTVNLDGLIAHNQVSDYFAMCWRTEVGNDIIGVGYGYKLHILYNVYATMSARSYNTINESPEALEFEWDLTCLPVLGTNHHPTAYFTLDSRMIAPGFMQAIENALYGTHSSDPKLLFPEDIANILNDSGNIAVTSYGYGLGPYGSGSYGG